MAKSWDELTPREKATLGYPEGLERKLLKDRNTWDQPKKERDDEYISRKNYSGEESPYWDWLHENGKTSGDDLQELTKANPDCVDHLSLKPADYIPEPIDKDLAVEEANRLAQIYLNRRELTLWNYARQHPQESWETIGMAIGITKRHVMRLLRSIQYKMNGHFEEM